MSDPETIQTSAPEVQDLTLHKDPTHTSIDGDISSVDGAHTSSNTPPSTSETNGTTTSEPVVMVAAPDTGTTDVHAQLLHPETTSHKDGTEQPTNPSNETKLQQEPHTTTTTTTTPTTTTTESTTNHEVKENHASSQPIPIDHKDIVPEITQDPTTTTTTEPSQQPSEINQSPPGTPHTKDQGGITKASSSSNLTNQNVSGVGPELRTSVKALRNSVMGIEMEEEYDENGVKVKKGKRKERSHSKIVVRHKKNPMGETIYKGHQSWVLMWNIQTGIRNAVGRGHSRSTITRPLVLSPSNPLVVASQSPSSHSPAGTSPINAHAPAPTGSAGGSPANSNPATPKYPADILGPSSFDSLAEFYATPKAINFPTEGSSQTIPHKTGPFKFKDYCPHAFRFLRHRFGIDTAEYMVSLCNTQKNGENALRELPTPGKSGSLFFFSHDMRFVIKTIPKDESKLLRSLLPSYVDHIAGDENTLLPKFFGMHRVKPHRGRQVRFLVMGNVFLTHKTIHERYDLKGSTLGRSASEAEKKKDTVTYKDLDFRERHIKIQIGPHKRSALVDQLQRDVKFLAKLNIMDYSLLIGIHNYEKDDGFISDPPSPQSSHVLIPKMPSNNNTMDDHFHSIFQSNDGGMRGVDEGGQPTGKIYYMGIIDILMLYSARKKLEHAYKTLRYGNREEISSVSPNEYATRFYEFVAASIT